MSDLVTRRDAKLVDPTMTWSESGVVDLETFEADADNLRRLLKSSLAHGDGRHELGGELGKGGMGEVAVALDRVLERRVALKQVGPDRATDVRAVASFVREARLAACLDHPNIVPVHDLGVRDGHRVYFTMKLVEGQDLAHRVRQEGVEGRSHDALLDLVEVLVKVCDALGSAHEQGILHCDVKPHNIMLGRFGAVYLMDWGLAREVGQGLPTDPPTASEDPDASWLAVGEAEGVAGTPSYMAPEQARGGQVDSRTDIFALGCVLYFVLVGRAPFAAPTRNESLGYAQRCAFQAPSELRPEIPHGLERIVLRAMAEDPSARYQDVSELREALVAYSRGGGNFRRLEVRAGEEIIRQGERGDRAYIIAEGSCEVLVDGARVRVMQAGEVFGETAILADTPRTASVRALVDGALMVVDRANFEDELARMSPWMARFIRTLATRLAEK